MFTWLAQVAIHLLWEPEIGYIYEMCKDAVLLGRYLGLGCGGRFNVDARQARSMAVPV